MSLGLAWVGELEYHQQYLTLEALEVYHICIIFSIRVQEL